VVLERLDARLLLLTRGEPRHGRSSSAKGAVTFMPIHGNRRDRGRDLCCAGDTVISTFTVALAAGNRSRAMAAWLANVGRRAWWS